MNDIAHAVCILRAGGLVAFPTETVYGLGADATNAAAVGRIFLAKGRPPTNPIIVHVADEEIAQRYAADWPDAAKRLAAKFWPGPLTLVVPRAGPIVAETSAGRGTVGLRSPDHPVALELLRAFDGAIAAPSANRSTRVSPTTAGHVREELGESVDLILDGGPCSVGIESTVLDLSGDVPTLLRPGAITQQQIAQIVGHVEAFNGSVDVSISAASPGQHAIHYAPKAQALRFERARISDAIDRCRSASGRIAWLCVAHERPQFVANWLMFYPMRELSDNPAGYAHDLYAALRELDRPDVEAILVEMPPDNADWAAIRDRLTRATTPLTLSTQ